MVVEVEWGGGGDGGRRHCHPDTWEILEFMSELLWKEALSLCACACVDVCVYARVCALAGVCFCGSVYAHILLCADVFFFDFSSCVRVYVCVRVCVYTCVRVCVYMLCLCVRVCVQTVSPCPW